MTEWRIIIPITRVDCKGNSMVQRRSATPASHRIASDFLRQFLRRRGAFSLQLKLLHEGKSEKLGESRSLQRATRRLLLFLALGLLAVFTATLLYVMSPQTSTEEIAQYSAEVITQAVNRLRTELERYEDISFQFVANQDLNNLLIEYVNAKDTYEVSEQNQRFSNFLEGLAFSDRSIHDALFLDEHNNQRKALTMGESLSNEFIKSFRRSGAYQAILSADGKPVWLGAVRTGKSERYYVMLGRRIKTLFTGKPLGVLVIFIKEDHLSQLLTSYLAENFYFSVGTVKNSYVFVLDRHGSIVSTPTSDNIGRSVADVLDNGQRLVIQLKGHSGRCIGRIGNSEVLIVFQSIPGTDWYLLVPVSPRTGLQGGLRSPLFRNVLVIVGTIAALGLASVAVWLIWSTRHWSSDAAQPAVVGALAFQCHGHDVATEQRIRSVKPGQPSTSVAWLSELTDREKQILGLLAHGYTNKEIAGLIHMAEQTVKNYVSTIYCKIGVHDRVQASLKAIEAGLHLSSIDNHAEPPDPTDHH